MRSVVYSAYACQWLAEFYFWLAAKLCALAGSDKAAGLFLRQGEHHAKTDVHDLCFLRRGIPREWRMVQIQ